MKTLLILLAVGLLAGCATVSTDQWDRWAEAEERRQARMEALAGSCTDDLCRVMIAQEANGGGTPPPRAQVHPAWGIVDRALTIGLPGYFQYKNTAEWAGALTGVTQSITSMERSSTVDNSVRVGGDQIGRDRIYDGSTTTTETTTIGGDYAGRDLGDRHRYSDSCVGDNCRNYSSGPIDDNPVIFPDLPEWEPSPEPEPEPEE